MRNGQSRRAHPTLGDHRLELISRLRARRPQIDEEIHARMREAAADDTATDNADYLNGRLKAVSAALDGFLEKLEQGDLQVAALPTPILAQVRRAAGAGVALDTVLVRYAAAREALSSVLLAEMGAMGLTVDAPLFGQALNGSGGGIEGRMAMLSAEYREAIHELSTPDAERRRVRCLLTVLANEPCDVTELGYEISSWHLGVIARGDRAAKSLREIAVRSNSELLLVPQQDDVIWAWMGTQRSPSRSEVAALFTNADPEAVSLAVGEPSKGLEGFRRTHLQAKAAQWVALRRLRPLTLYADVILLTAVMRDAEVEHSLRHVYLSPFSEPRDRILLETVRAYLTCGHNISSAAAALKADRGTVGRRLRTVEEKLGRQLCECEPEITLALHLDEIEQQAECQA